MSKARLVITAVVVEGRSKSEVARDYDVSRYWVQQLCRRYPPRVRRPSSRAPDAPTTTPTPSTTRSRTRSSGSARAWPDRAGRRRRHHPHPPARRPHPHQSPCSNDHLAHLDPPRLHHTPTAETPPVPGNGSPPSNPTNAGKPTSPTGTSPMAPAWKSSTSSTTTHGWPCPPGCGRLGPYVWPPRCGVPLATVRGFGPDRCQVLAAAIGSLTVVESDPFSRGQRKFGGTRIERLMVDEFRLVAAVHRFSQSILPNGRTLPTRRGGSVCAKWPARPNRASPRWTLFAKPAFCAPPNPPESLAPMSTVATYRTVPPK